MKCISCYNIFDKTTGSLSKIMVKKLVCPDCGIKEVHIKHFAGGLDKENLPRLQKALLRLPLNIFNYARTFIIFVYGDVGFYGKCFNLENYLQFGLHIKSVVYLPPNLWKHNQRKITEIVAHEIAHSFLNHVGSKETVTRCEREANQLKNQWLYKRDIPKKGAQEPI